MKKKVSAIIITSLCLAPLIGAVSAENTQPIQNAPNSALQEVISPRAEQTEWHYRIFNGQMQKRLWSLTENKWLTDWTNVSV